MKDKLMVFLLCKCPKEAKCTRRKGGTCYHPPGIHHEYDNCHSTSGSCRPCVTLNRSCLFCAHYKMCKWVRPVLEPCKEYMETSRSYIVVQREILSRMGVFFIKDVVGILKSGRCPKCSHKTVKSVATKNLDGSETGILFMCRDCGFATSIAS